MNNPIAPQSPETPLSPTLSPAPPGAAPIDPGASERREGQGPNRRQSDIDRRTGLERRQKTRAQSGYTGPERRGAEDRRVSGLERRRGPGRRLSDDRRSAEEGEMNSHQFEFVMAVQMYKRVNERMYPTWTEILEILHQLGYRKVEKRTIRLPNVPEAELD